MHMPQGNPWKPMELRMPRSHYIAADYFARRKGMTRSEWVRNAVAFATIAEWARLERDDPAEYARAIGVIERRRYWEL